MKYIIFLVLSVLLCGCSHAEFTQFDFSLDEYILSNEEYLKVNFKYLLSGYEETDFLVRPVVGNGVVEILNDDDEWVSSYDMLFNFPYLREYMRIRVRGLETEKSYLYFEIYNVKNEEIYQTPKKDIWTNKVYSGYLGKLNSSLSGIDYLEDILVESTESTESVVDSVILGNNSEEEFKKAVDAIPKSHFLFLGLGIFTISVAIGIKSGLGGKGGYTSYLIKKDNTQDGKIH